MTKTVFLNQKGQTLIEAVGALGVLGIVISAITLAVTTSLSNATYDKNLTIATKYTQQGSEIMQQIRDDNYATFQNLTGIYCLAQNQTTLTSGPCLVNMDGFYIRSVQIIQNGCGQNVSKITVSTSFKDGKCIAGTYCHTQIDSLCLSTTNPVVVP